MKRMEKTTKTEGDPSIVLVWGFKVRDQCVLKCGIRVDMEEYERGFDCERSGGSNK